MISSHIFKVYELFYFILFRFWASEMNSLQERIHAVIGVNSRARERFMNFESQIQMILFW